MAGQKTDARDVHVGQRIAEQRKKASLTQKRVAQSFGMSAAQLQKYEKGTNRISAIHLDIFSRMTGVPMDYFFEGMQRRDDVARRGFARAAQQAYARPTAEPWQGLAEIVGQHITEHFSEEARRDVRGRDPRAGAQAQRLTSTPPPVNRADLPAGFVRYNGSRSVFRLDPAEAGARTPARMTGSSAAITPAQP